MFHRFAEACETRIEFTLRVHSALHRILRQQAGKSVLIVKHGGVIEASFGFLFGHGEASVHRAYAAFANTSITHWRQEDNGPHWVLESSNDSHHLQRLGMSSNHC